VRVNVETDQKLTKRLTVLRSESSSRKREKLHNVTASNNRDHRQLLLFVRATYI